VPLNVFPSCRASTTSTRRLHQWATGDWLASVANFVSNGTDTTYTGGNSTSTGGIGINIDSLAAMTNASDASWGHGLPRCSVELDFGIQDTTLPPVVVSKLVLEFHDWYQPQAIANGLLLEASEDGVLWQTFELDAAGSESSSECQRSGPLDLAIRQPAGFGAAYSLWRLSALAPPPWTTNAADCGLPDVFHAEGYRVKSLAALTQSCYVSVEVFPGETQLGQRGSSWPAQLQSTTFEYSSDVTPIVNTVVPKFGPASGGTRVTISGAGLPVDVADAIVVIDDTECAVIEASAIALTCITSPRDPSAPASQLRVTSRRYGAAVLRPGAAFRYADLWSARETWAGEPPPKAGESVVVPAGQTIVYDLSSSPPLRLILVEGTLEFLDEGDVALDAEYIMVRGTGAAFVVGTEAAPFRHRATITLRGARATAREIPTYGAKVLAVRYGSLDLHGAPREPTWTRLAATAEPGSWSLTVDTATNWRLGDEVAIASSAWGPEEVETRRVTRVSCDGRTLHLDAPLAFRHWGQLIVRVSRPMCPARPPSTSSHL
jgi:G8 domain/IPT/TIG domain